MFKQILVPTDFSEKCTQAVDIAVRFALEGNAVVHILHVIEVISDTTFDEFESFYTKLENRAQKNMDKLITPVKVKPVNRLD